MWIAYCISGQLRTAACTHENIIETMIRPIQHIPHNIFLHLGFSARDFDETKVMRELVSILKPKNYSLSFTAHLTEGLELCRRDVEKTERVEHKTYTQIMRLRPDVVYELKMPVTYPHGLSNTQKNLLMTAADTLRPQANPSRWFVSDIWAIVPRRLLGLYFSKSRRGAASNLCNQSGPGREYNEFDLGCSMTRANEALLVVSDVSFKHKSTAWIVCLQNDTKCTQKKQPFLFCPHRRTGLHTISFSHTTYIESPTAR